MNLLLGTSEDAPIGEIPTFDEEAHRYFLGERELASVTKINGILDKPALIWWGMTIGADGLLKLIDLEGIGVVDYPLDRIVALLSIHKITVNHVRDNAAGRGKRAHKQLERYGREGTALNPAELPEEERGYLRGAAKFLIKHRPRIVRSEVMVWSYIHGFAGTFDVLAWIDGELWLLDWKTSKRVYDDYHLQLAAYEGALWELVAAGMIPLDQLPHRTGVVHLTADGESELVETVGTYGQFLAVKGAFDALTDLKSTIKQARKAARREVSNVAA